ncbi:MAG: hypothetical protein HOO91_05420 [Bacteroidales bacterium]|nr:hypothetical protein [Bacteroidales bacterium]
MKNILIGLLFALAILAGCSKNENIGLADSNNPTTDQSTLQGKLNILSMGILGASDDELVKEILYKEVEKKFDGEYNVLFNTLISECRKNGVDLIGIMQKHLNTMGYNENIEEVLKSFQNVEGVNYYPQVYVPFYSNKNQFKGTLKMASSVQVVTDNVQEGITPKTKFIGLQLSRDAKNRIREAIIDENIAVNNPVWVVSLNERVNNDGIYVKTEVPTNTKEFKNTVMVSYNVPNVSSVEGWTRGGPEFTVRFIPLSGQIVSQQNFESTRDEVNGNAWKTVNRYILSWDPNILNRYLVAHWLERDGGSSKILDLKFTVYGFTVTLPITVGSDDDDAGYQAMYYDDLSAPIFNTGWVRWDMQ